MQLEFNVPGPAFELNKIIKAGAGAGKTTALVNDLYHFFSDFKRVQKRLPKVIVTTFTKKATQELKERLLKKAIEENSEDFFSYINNKGLIHISTIHGVLHLFLKQFSDEFGFRKQLEVISENEEEQLQLKVLRKILSEQETLASLLNDYSILELHKFCTQYQFFYKINKKSTYYTQEQFKLELTREVQSALNIFDRVCPQLLNEKLSKSWENWVQSYWQFRKENNLESFSWLSEWLELQSKKPTKVKEDNEPLYGLQSDFLDALEIIRELDKNNYLSENFLNEFDDKMQTLTKLGQQFIYQLDTEKLKKSQISLRDIEYLVVENKEQSPEIYARFSQEWDFWMIDEYQDTSPLQESLLQVLIRNSSSFLVGDPQQSIYLFRGARSEIFIQKYKEYESRNWHSVLNKNYRSSAGVLNFINDFFTSEFDQFQAMETTKPDSDQVFDVEFLEVADSVEKLDVALEEITRLVNQGVALDEIAVLSRDNKELILFEKKIKDLSIPYFYHSGGNFFKKREIIDMLMMVKFLYNPFDENNFIGLLRSPWIGFSEDEILTLQLSKGKSATLFERLRENKEDSRIVNLVKALEVYSQWGLLEAIRFFLYKSGMLLCSYQKDPTGQLESNIWKLYFWLLQILSNKDKNILSEVDSILNSSIKEIELVSESSAVVEPRRIQLMTVHASKGLQFKYVFLLSADKKPKGTSVNSFAIDEKHNQWSFVVKNQSEENIYSPLAYAQKNQLSALESAEFWRLLYVALTRAKEKIYIFSSEKPIEGTWAHRLKNYFLTKTKPSYRFNFKNVDSVDLKSPTRNATRPSGDQIETFDPQVLLNYQHLSASKLSYTKSVKNSQTENSVKGFLIKEKGVWAHSQYEKSNLHLDTLVKIMPNYDWALLLSFGYKEFSFSYKLENKIYTGSIDLWGIKDGVCYIIDYKTGERIDQNGHFLQLKFYAESLIHLGLIEKEKIKLAVCYMNLNKFLEQEYSPIEIKTFLSQTFKDNKESK